MENTLKNKMKNIPSKIYLQTGHENPVADFNMLDLESITWSADRINDTDIEFALVRKESEELICPNCNSVDTQIIYAQSDCYCENCDKEFKA